MKIQLIDTRVAKLNIDFYASEDAANESVSEMKSFSFRAGFFSANEKKYLICFDLELVTECSMLIKLEYEAVFETDDEVTEEFRNSPFIAVNSPAIAYPYLRAYVSTFLTLSGFSSIILPTMNFQAMYKASLAEAKSE